MLAYPTSYALGKRGQLLQEQGEDGWISCGAIECRTWTSTKVAGGGRMSAGHVEMNGQRLISMFREKTPHPRVAFDVPHCEPLIGVS